MGWALVSVVGFVLVTGVVVGMARSNTARWERDHRAPQVAARAHGAAMRTAWTTTLSRWEKARESQDRPARRLHVPAGLAARLPHPHVPHLHLPHPHLPLHLPRVHLPRRSRSVPPDGSAEDPQS